VNTRVGLNAVEEEEEDDEEEKILLLLLRIAPQFLGRTASLSYPS
jgi:hypothetical protein